MGGRRFDLRAMVISAAMAALALVLPMAFHLAGLGSKFLPMLLPLLLNGFLVPAPWAILTGLVAPVLSSLLTGMPPLYPPIVAVLAAEGAVLGGVAALIFRRVRRLWPALIAAVIAGRLTALATLWVLAKLLALPPALASFAMIAQGLPGVVLQLVVVPIVVTGLKTRPSILFRDEPKT